MRPRIQALYLNPHSSRHYKICIRNTSSIFSLIILTELLTVLLWHLFALVHSSLLCVSCLHQNANIHAGISDLLGGTVCFPCGFGLSFWSSCYLIALTRVFNPCVIVFICSPRLSTAMCYPESVWVHSVGIPTTCCHVSQTPAYPTKSALSVMEWKLHPTKCLCSPIRYCSYDFPDS